MGKRFEIVVIALMIVSLAGTGFAIGHQKNKIDKLRSDSAAALEKALPIDAYREKQQKEVKAIIDDCEKELGKVRTQEEADKLIEEAKAEAKPIKTDAQLTKEEKKKAAEKARKEAAKKKAAAEKAAAEAAEEAARQEEEQQSYSYSNSGNSSGNSPGGGDTCVDTGNSDIWN